MRTLLLGVCIFISSAVMAQRECVSSAYSDQLKSIDPSFTNKMNEIEDFIRNQQLRTGVSRTNGNEGSSVIYIPVVVHILYHTAEQNISEAQVKSQIEALNRDFRRRNSDSSKTPDRFKSFAADVMIEFVLATADPIGRPTNGIIRKQSGVSEWKMDDKIKFSAQGGDDAWDSRSYLNLWVGNMRSILGYASIPGGPADRDGIVINASAFGTINISSSYNLGRTGVHEIGHWLGLKHIWGDTYCGDDLVDDTPKQGNLTSGCPTGIRISCNNGPNGDMYMNYMDVTGDGCMNLFTNGQKNRMLSLFNLGGPRNSLLSSKGLSNPWNHEPIAAELPLPNSKFKFFPNPVSKDIVVDFEHNQTWIGKTISIINLNGTIISKILINSKNQKINLSSLKPGLYFIQGENEGEKIREKFIKL